MDNQVDEWHQIRVQATAAILVLTITSILGGVVYLAHTVPRQLEQLLSNQTEFKSQLQELERKAEEHERRLIKIEHTR